MKYRTFFDSNVDTNLHEVEIVERKGIGHPDSLSDIIAEYFSNVYSRYCLDKYDVVLNHWFDKILISGGEAILKPGNSKVIKKPKVYLFGKITSIQNGNIPIKELFTDVVFKVFNSIFSLTKESMPEIVIDVNSGIGAEHLPSFYKYDPQSNVHVHEDVLRSNDTVFVVGYAPYSKLESYVCELENYINSKSFKEIHPYTGYDVKVLAQRIQNNLDVTICIPFIADRINSWSLYEDSKIQILSSLYKFTETFNWKSSKINLNTKDSKEKGFLTVYGTALDKGDFGVVGRGNRFPGFISANRGETQEAYHGKNPIIHSGKLLTVIAHRVARRIYNDTNIPTKVSICINNGSELKKPECIYIFKDNQGQVIAAGLINRILQDEFDKMDILSEKIILSDPIEEFRSKNLLAL